MSSDIQQVIILRKDLNMRKGKMVAQGAHASMKVFFDRLAETRPVAYDGVTLIPGESRWELNNLSDEMVEWIKGSFKKIAVSVNSEAELLDLYNKAKEMALPASLIQDSGLTEFHGQQTYTAVAIGPALKETLQPLTGSLPLL